MITLEKSIFTDKKNTRPRVYLPIDWYRKNGEITYLIADEDFIILLPKSKEQYHKEIKEKIKSMI